MEILKKLAKNTFINIILSFGSIFVFLIFIEVLLRIIGFNPFGELLENEGRSIFIRPSNNPERVYEATPNTKGIGWGTHVSINALGFRGKEYLLEKPENTYRIVVIGDSIAFGNNLPPDKNFPAILEKKYADAGKKVEVLNLGLGGYDTLQAVATLDDIGLALQPDLVILAYCINDIGVASGNVNYIKRLQKYGSPLYYSRLAQLVRVNLDRIDLIKHTEEANKEEAFSKNYQNKLADINHDVALVEKMQALTEQLHSMEEKYPFTHDYTDAIRIQRLRYALEKLKKIQQQHGFPVFAIIIPFLQEDEKNQPLYHAVYGIVEHEMRRVDFRILNMYPDFSQAGLQSLLLKKEDGVHPNATGHQLMADTIYQTIDTD